MSGAEREAPSVDHPLYGPFWRAAAAGRVAMQRCETCGYVRWPPEPICPECLTPGGLWVDLLGRGRVWSTAVYEHAFAPALRAELPYVCALVELEEGPRLVTRVVGIEPAAVEPGLPVVATFVEIATGGTLVCFTPERR